MRRTVYLVTSAIGVLLLALTPGCASLPSPAVRAFGDNKFWITLEDMTYRIGNTSESIVVPTGFVTDFASIPQALSSYGLSPHGKYSRAAIVHDYLYWAQGCTRAQSDRLLVIAMKESNVGGFDEFAIHRGVDFGGSFAWKKNAEERAQRLPRLVPSQFLRPADPNMLWSEYRTFLVQQGVMDPPFPIAPSYCKYGDSTVVPGKS